MFILESCMERGITLKFRFEDVSNVYKSDVHGRHAVTSIMSRIFSEGINSLTNQKSKIEILVTDDEPVHFVSQRAIINS